MNHANPLSLPAHADTTRLQAAILEELLQELEGQQASHLVLSDAEGRTREVLVEHFVEDCRRRRDALQQQLDSRN